MINGQNANAKLMLHVAELEASMLESEGQCFVQRVTEGK